MFQMILFTILTALCFPIYGKTLELKKNSGTIFIQQLANWKLGKELFGMPFIYFSPQTNGQSSNISFTDTGSELELDIKILAQTQKKYHDGRNKWANTVGADPLSFDPYSVSINKNGHRVHSVGFIYAHEGKVYVEKSYYIECKGKLLFSKSLRLKENHQHDIDFDKLLQNIDCGGV